MKKSVLSLDLNSGRVVEFLRFDGRKFQTEGTEGTFPERFGVTLWDFEELLTR